MSKFFDPLGLQAPVLIKAKILMQDVWKRHIKWDDPLPEDLLSRWLIIRTDLDAATTTSVPRFIGGTPGPTRTYELHVYCDAAVAAYAAVAYLRSSSAGTNIVFCKTKVAPVKEQSVPRLELMAAVLGARAITFLRKQLQPPLHLVKVVLWSDSTTVLQWLRSEHKLPQFVQNRVSAIKSVPDVIHRYIATAVNPADLPSRGISASSLQDSTLWWNGPPHQSTEYDLDAVPAVNPVDIKIAVPAVKFEDVSSVPVIDAGAADIDVKLADTECVKSRPDCHVKLENTTVYPPPLGIDITRFSSFDLLIRISALCLRLIARLRKAKSSSGPLSRHELARAEILWIQHVQASKYADVVQSLTKAGRKPDIVQQLNLFLDDSGIIRCKGRLGNSELTHQARFPALLPRSHPATNLIIVDCHRKVLHGGVAHTLSRVRYQFWIPQGRAAVKQVLRLCRTCVRWEGGPYRTPAMAPLPASRVTPANPFSKVGLDYFGPVQLRVDAKAEPLKGVGVPLHVYGHPSCPFGACDRHVFDGIPVGISPICRPSWHPYSCCFRQRTTICAGKNHPRPCLGGHHSLV